MKNLIEFEAKTKATIYTKSEFFGSVTKQEIYLHKTFLKDYAQYKDCFSLEYTVKRKRSVYQKTIRGHIPFCVILKGWDNIEPSSMFGAETVRNGVTTKQSKYSCFDARYISDFLELIKDIDKNNFIALIN